MGTATARHEHGMLCVNRPLTGEPLCPSVSPFTSPRMRRRVQSHCASASASVKKTCVCASTALLAKNSSCSVDSNFISTATEDKVRVCGKYAGYITPQPRVSRRESPWLNHDLHTRTVSLVQFSASKTRMNTLCYVFTTDSRFFLPCPLFLHWKFVTQMSRKIYLDGVLNNCLYKTGLTSSPAFTSVRSASHCRGHKENYKKNRTFSLIALWGWLVLF